MAVIISDDFATGSGDIFNRAPPTNTNGTLWKRTSGNSFDVAAGGYAFPNASTAPVFANIDAGTSDLDITTVVSWTTAVDRFGVGASTQTALSPSDASGYMVWNTDDANVRLSWFDSSAARTDITTVSAGLTFATSTSYTFRLVLNGTSIKFYIDGALIIDTTDSNITSRPFAGLHRFAPITDYTRTRYESFTVETVSTATPTGRGLLLGVG